MPEVRIPKDGVGHNNSGDILGRSGIVVSCVRETNDRLYYVVVYMLLDTFKAYDSKVLVKGTPNSICICGDEVQ